MKTFIAITLITVLLIALRVYIGLTIEPESASFVGSYQAFAHLFVGGLAVISYYRQERWPAVYLWLLIAVEVAAALLSRLL